MKMNFGGVCHNFHRPEGLIISLFTACLLAISPIHGAATCPQNIDIHKVGFCGSNGSYHEWDCRNCPPGLGHLIECGKVYYDKEPNVDCQPCKKGTYSDSYDYGQCKKCASCQKNQSQIGECNSQRDTIQCFCNPGFYKAHGHCKPCSWCCGDKTNEHVDECRNLQKKCSFQDVKSCGPTTTPSLTTVLPTGIASTTSSTTTSSSNSLLPITETTTPTTKNSSVLSSLNTTETSNDSAKTEKESTTDPTRSGDKESDGHTIIWAIVAVLLTLFILIGLIVGIYYFCRSGNSSGGTSDSEQGSISTGNELNSSAPLISGAEEKGKSTHENGENTQTSSNDAVTYSKRPEKAQLISGADEKKNSTIENTKMTCMCSKDTDSYTKGPETVPFLTTSGDQEKLGGPAEGTITGRDFPPNTLENPSCSTNTPENHTESTIGQLSTGSDVSSLAVGGSVITCMDTPNTKDNAGNTRQLTKEEKLDLPVTELPLEIYRKVCALLDPEDPFFCDYRMVAENFGVSKEQTRALIKPPTDSLLIEHKPKVKVLMEILEGMKREDVMEVVEEWLSQC